MLRAISLHPEAYEKALKKGVKFQYVSNIPKQEKKPQTIQMLMKAGSFELKCFSVIPGEGFDILDGKRVHIISAPRRDFSKIEILRLNNPTLLELT